MVRACRPSAARLGATVCLILLLGPLGTITLRSVTPQVVADPCGGAVVLGNGGSQCDGPPAPDGSFQRCVSVYVLGIGGWNCYTVYPPVPR